MSIPSVAPHAGAWVETGQNETFLPGLYKSPPTRGRGLKLFPPSAPLGLATSPPTRGRGLKLLFKNKVTGAFSRPPRGGVG